jgi:hypothetical protein
MICIILGDWMYVVNMADQPIYQQFVRTEKCMYVLVFFLRFEHRHLIWTVSRDKNQYFEDILMSEAACASLKGRR